MTHLESRLIVDPTIDAREHTGIYPQGFTPPLQRERQCSRDTQANLAPQFGRAIAGPPLQPLLGGSSQLVSG